MAILGAQQYCTRPWELGWVELTVSLINEDPAKLWKSFVTVGTHSTMQSHSAQLM